MSAARLIRSARTAQGLTQAELADCLGVTQAAIAQLEAPGANPSVDRLAEVVAATGLRLRMAVEPPAAAVDETLLAQNLRLTPAERLDAFETAIGELAALRGLVGDGG